MSLGGIALAIGDLVDAGIVMTENAYKSLVNAVLKQTNNGKAKSR